MGYGLGNEAQVRVTKTATTITHTHTHTHTNKQSIKTDEDAQEQYNIFCSIHHYVIIVIYRVCTIYSCFKHNDNSSSMIYHHK